MDVLAGIDIGGSHIGYGFLSKADHSILFQHHEHLDHTFEPQEIIDQIVSAIKVVMKNNPQWTLIGAGIGCPGHCKNGVLVAASNLPTFKQVPLASMVSKALDGITTVLLNDADAAVAAEVWGPHAGSSYTQFNNIAMITVGTGVGLGLILNNQLYHGSNGLIEGGHMIISTDKTARLCGCGQRGCAELTASAKQTAKKYLEAAGKDPNTEHFGAKQVFELASNGDDIAIQVLEETAQSLAIMCLNVCRVIDPDVIIFAGGMSQAGEQLLQLVRKHIDKLTWTVLPTSVVLVTAHSVEHAGVVGAALAADQAHNLKNIVITPTRTIS